MLFRAIVPALAAVTLTSSVALAQSGTPNPPAKPAPSADLPQTGDPAQDVPQKIRDELTSQGFKNVKVVPGSFIVSARNKDDQPVMMLIGPGGMTVMTGKPDHDSQAKGMDSDDDRNEIIQQ
jgi:hypothetical protein